jgi:hypothetical protein
MPQVICNLQNMSGSVSGVAFTRAPDSDSWISEVVSDALADQFAAIPGYFKISGPEPEAALALPDPPPASPARKGK